MLITHVLTSAVKSSVQVTQGDIWPPSPNSWKTHCAISQVLLTAIYLFILPSFLSLFFISLEVHLGVAVGFVCRLVCLTLSAVMLADVWHLELNDYRMIVKGWGAFSDGGLSPQPCRLSHISSWGGGELGERRERGLAESTCRTCPEAHLSTS